MAQEWGQETSKTSSGIQKYVKRRFTLLPEYLDLLRCFEYNGLVNEKQIRCIRIFSPDRAREHHLSIKTNEDLGQYSEMLLFVGHIDSHDSVYVADRRAPLRQAKGS